MANKKKIKNNVNTAKTGKDRAKWGRIAQYILIGLIFSIPFCLLCGWLFGDTKISEIGDNFVTALIQNYNYILGTLVLIPVIAYIYSKIKEEMNKKLVSDSSIVLWGFIAVIVVIAAIIVICKLFYPINSTTYYGQNSCVSICFFLSAVIIVILESIVCLVLKIIDFSKEKGKLLKAIGRYSPIILLVLFLIWTFISCLLAPSNVDYALDTSKAMQSIIGSSDVNAENIDIMNNEVLSKTLNGCYNLKDGYWAFLMYGSIFLAAMLIEKNELKGKKNLIKGFVLVITFLSVLTIGVTIYTNVKMDEANELYEQYKLHSGELNYGKELTKSDFTNIVNNELYQKYAELYIYPSRGVFRNSNHFAYVLCMAALASAVLIFTEKKWWQKLLYILTFIVILYMLIINNTFGGYLGVTVALVCLFIYKIVDIIRKAIMKDENGKLNNILNESGFLIVICAIFLVLTFNVKGEDGNAIAVKSIQGFVKDIGIFGGYMTNTENPTEVDVSTLDNSIRKAGSGRGETWIKVWELIKQRPMFGYGLECLLFQFNGQFGVNEGRTHNLLLQLLATVGIPGTIMYFSALAIIFIRLLKNWKTWDDVEKICVFVGIAYMVTALTGNSTYYTSPYFMMFLGFVALTPWKREDAEKN